MSTDNKSKSVLATLNLKSLQWIGVRELSGLMFWIKLVLAVLRLFSHGWSGQNDPKNGLLAF